MAVTGLSLPPSPLPRGPEPRSKGPPGARLWGAPGTQALQDGLPSLLLQRLPETWAPFLRVDPCPTTLVSGPLHPHPHPGKSLRTAGGALRAASCRLFGLDLPLVYSQSVSSTSFLGQHPQTGFRLPWTQASSGRLRRSCPTGEEAPMCEGALAPQGDGAMRTSDRYWLCSLLEFSQEP